MNQPDSVLNLYPQDIFNRRQPGNQPAETPSSFASARVDFDSIPTVFSFRVRILKGNHGNMASRI